MMDNDKDMLTFDNHSMKPLIVLYFMYQCI